MEPQSAKVCALQAHTMAMFGIFSCHFDRKHVQTIGLKAPMNYYDQFRSNQKFDFIFLLERPKPNTSMISGFSNPGEPLFMDLNLPKYTNILQEI